MSFGEPPFAFCNEFPGIGPDEPYDGGFVAASMTSGVILNLGGFDNMFPTVYGYQGYLSSQI